MPSTNPLLEAALQYAGRGWRVFPLHSVWFKSAETPVCTCYKREACGTNAGKHPRITGGFKGATTDRAQIEEWWAKWPDANIGIATGNGLTVMDIDGEQGRDELLELLAAKLGDFPSTLAARTGNGGHLYFACEGPKSAAKGHLHVRGEGGYVVAPPSIHRTGRRYEWIDATLAPAVPSDWLRSWFLAGGDRKIRGESHAEMSGASGSQQRPTGGAEAGVKGGFNRSDSLTHESGTGIGSLSVQGTPPAWVAAKLAARSGAGRLVHAATVGTPWTAHEEARLRSALRSIPASIDGRTWASILMALHDLQWRAESGADIGLDIADEWSRTSTGRGEGLGLYRGREDLEKRWASFSGRIGNAHSVTVASVYHLAAEHGWKGDVVGERVNGHKVEGVNGHSFAFGQTFGGVGSGGGGPIFVDTYRNGDPKPTCVNSRIAIRALGLTCKYNTFRERLEIGGQTLKQWSGEHGDKVTHVLRGLIHQNFGFDPGSQPAHDAVVQECLDKSYDPVADYLDGLEWDRVPRLGHWMTKYLGAQPSHLNSTIGALGLIAACRRVRVPGSKFDAITVLVSDEGFGKSKAIEILAGEYFCDQQILNLDEKAQQEMMQGVWLYEIADLAGMGKADVDKVKAFASRRVDRARPAYAKNREDRPRRCVFYATTNMQNFLKSQTGNRRFWPVQVGSRLKEDDLRRDRDQIWAEANELERAGVPLELPEALWGEAAALQLERMEPDSWDDLLSHINPGEAYETSAHGFKDQGGWKEYRVTTKDLFELHLKISADRQHDGSYKRLAYVMRRLGWDGPKQLRVRGIEGKARGFTKLCTT